MTIGIRVSRSGLIRGLPTETETETAESLDGRSMAFLPLRKSFCGRTVKPPRLLRFL